MIKAIKLCGISLAVDGSEDRLEMSSSLYRLIYEDAVAWDDLPAKYKLPPVQALGRERRRKLAAEQKATNKHWRYPKCGYWSSNFYAKKTKAHRNKCFTVVQIHEWVPRDTLPNNSNCIIYQEKHN